MTRHSDLRRSIVRDAASYHPSRGEASSDSEHVDDSLEECLHEGSSDTELVERKDESEYPDSVVDD